VYDGARVALQNAAIQSVVAASYAGVYVDEYQDCSKRQHDLISELSGVLPCRIVSDPLQSIFDFDSNDPLPH